MMAMTSIHEPKAQFIIKKQGGLRNQAVLDYFIAVWYNTTSRDLFDEVLSENKY